jgi:hypothetical protein
MKDAGYAVRESDPFEDQLPILFNSKDVSPYANRIRLIWSVNAER